LEGLYAAVKAAGARSDSVVEEGIKLFDSGDYAGAAKKYREAISVWPQNGWAYYELGYAIRVQDIIAAGEKPDLPGPNEYKSQINEQVKVPFSAESKAAYAQCRRYSPLMPRAYQGDEADVLRGTRAMAEEILPAKKDLAESHDPAVIDRAIAKEANGCQDAGIHEFALVARQTLVARRGRYDALDHPFIVTSLRALVPGPDTEDVLERLAKAKAVTYRLIATEDQLAPPVLPAAPPTMFKLGTPQLIREKNAEDEYMVVVTVDAQKPEQFDKPGLKLVYVFFDDPVTTPPIDLEEVDNTSAVYMSKDKKTPDLYWTVHSAQQNLSGTAHAVMFPPQYKAVGKNAVLHWGIKAPPDKDIGLYVLALDDTKKPASNGFKPASNVLVFRKKYFTEGNCEDAYKNAVEKLSATYGPNSK
jgi:hypothetical protein